eukprot:Gb_11936 [translate_table: standard]
MHVQTIDISKNKLGGQIPATIENCSELQSLNLSWNALQGPIPNSLAQLKSLEDVDLSRNNLSGSIPKSLEKLAMFRQLNLSFNNFSGEIPCAGVFRNLTVTSFMGNPGLCEQWVNMHNCSGRRIYVKHSKWRLILGISVGVVFLSFKAVIDKLGQGGFGQVFKGKLPNGSLVAVKLLDKSRQSEQQFLNEVATIGRIHHLHLVRLLGYCFQKSKSALVYEYMINGSLEKYIHGSQDTHPDHVLDWKQLYSIAIGTARGIAYLHEDCANRILHCDIKPHNVLLDANYSPRVGDFGLAKLGKREESHMSMTAARGTPGYAAPEMWSRNHGPVTDKSDVYSYGMLLLEMAEKGEFGNRRMRSEVEVNDGMNMEVLEAEDENIAKKLTLIGLSCIHYDSSHRPSMVKVIQMLEGSVQVTIPSFTFPPAYVPVPVPASISSKSSSYSF